MRQARRRRENLHERLRNLEKSVGDLVRCVRGLADKYNEHLALYHGTKVPDSKAPDLYAVEGKTIVGYDIMPDAAPDPTPIDDDEAKPVVFLMPGEGKPNGS